MKIRIRMDAIFNSEDVVDAKQLQDTAIALQPKMQSIDPLDYSYMIIEECRHDESPVQPCKIIYTWQK